MIEDLRRHAFEHALVPIFQHADNEGLAPNIEWTARLASLSPGASGVFLSSRRSRRFVTVDTCQQPPRRVSMPRLFSCAAIARRLVAPPARMSSTTGARSRACRSALRAMAARSGAPPLPARQSAAAPLGLPAAHRGSWPPPAPPWPAWRSPPAPAAPPAP